MNHRVKYDSFSVEYRNFTSNNREKVCRLGEGERGGSYRFNKIISAKIEWASLPQTYWSRWQSFGWTCIQNLRDPWNKKRII